MQKFRALLSAIFSILIPLIVYVLVLPAEGADQIAGTRAYISLIASNVVGFALAFLAVAVSSRNLDDTSPVVLIAILSGSIGMLANLFVVEFMLYAR